MLSAQPEMIPLPPAGAELIHMLSVQTGMIPLPPAVAEPVHMLPVQPGMILLPSAVAEPAHKLSVQTGQLPHPEPLAVSRSYILLPAPPLLLKPAAAPDLLRILAVFHFYRFLHLPHWILPISQTASPCLLPHLPLFRPRLQLPVLPLRIPLRLPVPVLLLSQPE